MADERYVFVYKCRMCGEAFKDQFTGVALATTFIIQSACDLKKDTQHPGDKTIHFAEDHIGIADLIGCKIEGNEE